MTDVSVKIPGRITYVTGTVNGLPTTWTLSGDHVWSAKVSKSSDGAYNIKLEAINDAGDVTNLETTIYYGLHLVTDRKPGTYYDVCDLNRVGAAFEYLQDRLNNDFGFNINLAIKTDWNITDEPTQLEMTEYLQNLVDIRTAIHTSTSPPKNMNDLTVEESNDIERILREVEKALNVIQLSWWGCGEIGSGEQ